MLCLILSSFIDISYTSSPSTIKQRDRFVSLRFCIIVTATRVVDTAESHCQTYDLIFIEKQTK